MIFVILNCREFHPTILGKRVLVGQVSPAVMLVELLASFVAEWLNDSQMVRNNILFSDATKIKLSGLNS